jgi:hypothetical protein
MTTFSNTLNGFIPKKLFFKSSKQTWDQTDAPVYGSRKTIDIEQAAREDGSRNLPSQDASTPTDTEHAILNQSQDALNSVFKHAVEESSVNVDLIQEAEMKISEADPDGLVEKASIQIKEIHDSYKRRLLDMYKIYLSRKGFLLKFKDENKLYHEANFPESILLHMAWIMVIIFGESLFNSFFYSKISDLGLIGGLGWSVVFSIANTGIAYMLGWVARYKNHIKPIKQIWGYVAIATFVIAGFVLNQAIAHARDIMSTGVMPAGPVLLDAIIHHTWELSITGWVLFVIGAILIAPFAYTEGYKSDDPYPEYKNLTLASRKSLDDFENAVTEMNQEVARIIDETGPKFDESAKEVSNCYKNLMLVLIEVQKIQNQYHDAVIKIASGCKRNIELYRQTNMRCRPGAPAPAYFDDFSCCEFTPRAIPGLDIHDAEQGEMQVSGATKNQIIAKIRGKKSELNGWHKSLTEDFKTELEQIKAVALNPNIKSAAGRE